MVYDLQRASMWKRISAWFLDTILLVIMVTGFMWIISAVDNYDKYEANYNRYLKDYQEKYDTNFSYTREEYNALPEADRARYEEAYKAFAEDKDVLYAYNMVVNLTLVNTTLSILLAFAVLEFLVPLILKNGQTIGKRVFTLGVIRTDGIRLTPLQLVVRTFLGKFTIETMIPVLLIIMIFFNTIGFTGIIVIFAIFAFNCGLMIATRTNSCIHDVFAVTVVVDLPSQMIFDTPEDLMRYKEEYAAEKAARSQY